MKEAVNPRTIFESALDTVPTQYFHFKSDTPDDFPLAECRWGFYRINTSLPLHAIPNLLTYLTRVPASIRVNPTLSCNILDTSEEVQISNIGGMQFADHGGSETRGKIELHPSRR